MLTGTMNGEELRTRAAESDVGKWDVRSSEVVVNPDGTVWVQKVTDAGTRFKDLPGHLDMARLTLTQHAFGQMCGRVAAPPKYVRSLPPALMAGCLNYGLSTHARGQVLIRAKGAVVRAFLSRDYTPIDDTDVLDMFMELAGPMRHTIRQLHIDENGMWLKILVEELTRDDPSRPGEPLKVGLLLGNSEVGCRSISIEPFVYRKACTNDLVVQVDDSLRARHVHLRVNELKGRAAEAMSKALKSGDELLDAMAAANNIRVEKPAEVLKELIARRRLSQTDGDAVHLAYAAEPADNRMGIVNALTRAAQHFDGDKRIELERFAGGLLIQGDNEWTKLEQQASDAVDAEVIHG